jgi:predicted secreted protein
MKIDKRAAIALALALTVTTVPLAAQNAAPPSEQQLAATAKSLKPQHGKIPLPEARATLEAPRRSMRRQRNRRRP